MEARESYLSALRAFPPQNGPRSDIAVWQTKLYPILQPPVPGGWQNWPGLPSLRAAFSALFGPEDSEFSATMLHWGPYDHHDARLWLEDDDDDEDGTMLIRLDLHILDRAFVCALAALITEAGLRLRLQDGTTIKATEDSLRTLIGESNAARFMHDPWTYLDSLPQETSHGLDTPAS